jgi:hypothetical protein
MKCSESGRRLEATHGVIASYPDDFFGYFGWPTVARTQDGTLVVAASGLRNAHVCPFGRTVLCVSRDRGETWTAPWVVNDYAVDDRDAGIVSPAPGTLVVSWFSSDTRISTAMEDLDSWEDARKQALYRDGLRRITDDSAGARTGFWIRKSGDFGETWNEPVRVALTAPHGPIVLSDGRLLFFGKGDLGRLADTETLYLDIGAMVSDDLGDNWMPLGSVPLADGTDGNNYYEPHVVELERDHLLGLIRFQDWKEDEGKLERKGYVPFSIAQTVSRDGGKTWTKAVPLGFHGSPPHVIKHSSGVLVCVYGYRKEPYGQRVMLSSDDGASWDYHYILRDDGPDSDLGYPSSVELDDGSIFTVYYQKVSSPEEQCGLLWSRWRLP